MLMMVANPEVKRLLVVLYAVGADSLSDWRILLKSNQEFEKTLLIPML